ncbi:MAG: hypothetical protein IH942_07145 [Acidobacteria bacterium]|nr:hypothetical protein [Acidobacteriota bacterium]
MQAEDTAKVSVNITLAAVDEAHLERLREAGVEIESVLTSLRIVSGLVEEAQFDEILELEGIDLIERSRVVGIPKPAKGRTVKSPWVSKTQRF